jgi:hypothetical protein
LAKEFTPSLFSKGIRLTKTARYVNIPKTKITNELKEAKNNNTSEGRLERPAISPTKPNYFDFAVFLFL